MPCTPPRSRILRAKIICEAKVNRGKEALRNSRKDLEASDSGNVGVEERRRKEEKNQR